MYIVRWLMGHPIIAFFVLGGVAILLALDSGQMGGIAKQDRALIEHSDNSTNVVVEDATNLSSEKSNDLSNNIAAVDNNKPAEQPVKDVVNSSSDSVTTLAKEKEEISPATSFISSEQKEATKNTSSEPTDLGQASSEEMLQMAREAYWNNGLDEAAQIYKQLIEQEPKVLEHKGELGNVYWRQGYPKKAAELYSEIAIPMIENGNSDRVVNMIKFIELHYPDRAAEIHEKIQLKQK